MEDYVRNWAYLTVNSVDTATVAETDNEFIVNVDANGAFIVQIKARSVPRSCLHHPHLGAIITLAQSFVVREQYATGELIDELVVQAAGTTFIGLNGITRSAIEGPNVRRFPGTCPW